MLIHCTKKLQEALKIKPDAGKEEDPLFSWHANLLVIDRRKTLVLVNDSSRYVVVLYGMKAKEFANVETHIKSAIRATLLAEGIREEVVAQYLESAGAVSFAKSKAPKFVARLNKGCENVQWFADEIDAPSLYQPDISMRVSRLLTGTNNKDYFNPNEKMYGDLAEMFGGSIFPEKAAVLKVTLDLGDHQIWRRLTVPLHFTFRKLHEALQVAFSWQDSHLHEFYICANPADGECQPVMNLVSHEEAFAFPAQIERRLEQGIQLSAYMPQYEQLVYVYDFGDDWRHTIQLEKVVSDYAVNHPVCLDGEGDAPPEDCGGEGGFDEFLRVLADPEDPAHDHLSGWGEAQGYEAFNLLHLNGKLEDITSGHGT